MPINRAVFAAFLCAAVLTGCKKPQPAADAEPVSSTDLITARKGFTTRIVRTVKWSDPVGRAPGGVQIIKYCSDVGELLAQISADPRDNKKHPAIIWAHGGFGGVDEELWRPGPVTDDQSVTAFRDTGLIICCPSWRGENDNPGQYEMFYGEVNDLLAIRDHLASLPYVDPQRIYLAGHSTGGTMALLGSVCGAKFRAVFSFGGAPDIYNVVSNGEGYGTTPFDFRDKQESRLRSAIHFTGAIRQPTFYFEGEDSAYVPDARRMKQLAQKANVPFDAFILRGGDHFNILHPLTRLIAAKIRQDTGPTCNITLDEEEVKQAFAKRAK